MRVFVLGRGMPHPDAPLLGIFEFQQARALAEAGHDVVYAALDIRFVHHWRPWGLHRHEVDGVHVMELSLPLGRLQYRAGYRFVEAAWAMLYRACVRAHGRPDIVHSHFVGWSAAAARAKRWFRYPLVVTEHTSRLMADEPPPAWMAEGIGVAYAAADVLIAVSPGLADRIRRLTGHDAVYVPNMVDAGVFAEVAPAAHARPRLVTVGNLIKRKRVDALLEAFADAVHGGGASPGEPLDAELVVIGEGGERDRLVALARDLGTGDRVTFTGHLDHPAIAAEFARCDGFVLASSQETFGVVLIEAMAAGLPVAATRSGGPEHFVAPETGVLAGWRRPELTAALRELLTRRWDRDVIRRYAIDHHSPQVIAARLTQLYAGVLSTRR